MKPITHISAWLAASCLAASLGAQVLMIDFGPTIVVGDTLTNSPYHAENGAFSGTVWNQVQTSGIAAGGLRWADGTTATAVSLHLGATTKPGVTILDLHATPTGNHALSAATNTGVYEGVSAGADGIYTSAKSGNSRAVGAQVVGLAPGTYHVYVVARNTNTTDPQTQQVHVGTAPAAADFDFAGSGYATRKLAYAHHADATGRWVEGANYARFTVSITTGDVLNIASIGGAGNEQRGFLNCVQIVTVPSP